MAQEVTFQICKIGFSHKVNQVPLLEKYSIDIPCSHFRVSKNQLIFRIQLHSLPYSSFPFSKYFHVLDLQFLLYPLHFAPPQGREIVQFQVLLGREEHRPHLSDIVLQLNKTKYASHRQKLSTFLKRNNISYLIFEQL